jgi:DNA-binding CsgD family transcriptional regulator/tetratricopeptide (TPR) repeat protein
VLLGDAVAPPVVRSLVEATGGNPLALLELRATLDADRLAGLVPLDAPLPVGREIEEWFGQRVAALPERARDALVIAAVCGGNDVLLIERTAGALGFGLDDLGPAETSRFVSFINGRLEFLHPLMRSAVYHGATPATRRRVHRAAVAVLEDGDPDVRAWHLAAATAGPDEGSASALVDAAGRAMERGAVLTAARIAERAAAITPDAEMRARRLRLAAKLSCDAGRLDPAIALLDEALRIARDPALRAEINWYQGGIHLGRGEFDEGLSVLLQGADLVAAIDPAQAATLLRWAIPVLHMRMEARELLACADRVTELVTRSTPEPSVMEVAQEARGEALTLLGRAAEGVPLLLETAAMIEPSQGIFPIGLLHEALVWVEEYDVARSTMLRSIAGYRAAGVTVSSLLTDLADLDFRTGRWAQSLSSLGEALAIAENAGQTKQLGYALSRLVTLDAVTGKESDCRQHAAELRDRGGETADLALVRCRTEAALGLLDLGGGRVEDAIDHLETVAALMRSLEVREPGVLWWAADLIQAYVQAGRTADAERELDALAALANESGRTWALAAAARCRGLLAGRVDASGNFVEALEWHARTHTPFESARTRLCYGQVLRRDGHRVAAREQLHGALATFEALGARAWVEQTRKELRASGEVLRRRGGIAPSGELTPQQLQIAFLISEGATNKEAAARLFLSPKTIENHLSQIYRKLDVRTRTELAHRLMRDASTAETSTESPRIPVPLRAGGVR